MKVTFDHGRTLLESGGHGRYLQARHHPHFNTFDPVVCSLSPFFHVFLARPRWCALDATFDRAIQRLLLQGCRYFSFWGSGSAEAEERADGIIIASGQESADACIITTSEETVSFEDELWHVIFSYLPDSAYERDCLSLFVLTFDDVSLFHIAREAVTTPLRFGERVLKTTPATRRPLQRDS